MTWCHQSTTHYALAVPTADKFKLGTDRWLVDLYRPMCHTYTSQQPAVHAKFEFNCDWDNWRLEPVRILIVGLHWVSSKFLANVNSRSRSLYAIARPSVVCRLSSVTLVHPTQALQVFGNISTEFGTLAIRWHPLKISRRSSQGNPSAGGVKHKSGSKI